MLLVTVSMTRRRGCHISDDLTFLMFARCLKMRAASATQVTIKQSSKQCIFALPVLTVFLLQLYRSTRQRSVSSANLESVHLARLYILVSLPPVLRPSFTCTCPRPASLSVSWFLPCEWQRTRSKISRSTSEHSYSLRQPSATTALPRWHLPL